MLTLLLLRHAKAVQHSRDGDFNRCLTERGECDAASVASHMAFLALHPDFAFVSPSARTRQTFSIVEAGLRRAIPARADEALYNADAAALRDLLRIVEPRVRTLLIVGHNPGIMEVAIAMARDGDVMVLERLRAKFPPCSLAVVTFDTDDWLDARAAGGRLDLFLIPADLVAPS